MAQLIQGGRGNAWIKNDPDNMSICFLNEVHDQLRTRKHTLRNPLAMFTTFGKQPLEAGWLPLAVTQRKRAIAGSS